MRRTSIVVLFLAVIAAGFVPTAALASQGAHFNKQDTFATVSDGTLLVSFKAAGLGDITSADVIVTGTAECINGGDKHPKASNKEAFVAEATVSVQNGQATGSDVDFTPSPGPHCGAGQTLTYVGLEIFVGPSGTASCSESDQSGCLASTSLRII